ncbi:signal peptidase I SipW [Fervidibacillus halotolerans]|uniref:Signal peptidase I n=1 Tax=Fervidibacillus halotolerans TaxID=2980027 RepID=A0A9E8RXJ8_9BACI|nr:signal peptidase I [Fervidibacillus halotolerans]WAA11836.1 signal peptidase I [Fervidibacillus halotolerans]
MKKIIKITGNVLYGLLIATLIMLTVIVISSRASGGEPELFGYQLKIVLSGSMEPTFDTGSIIIVKKLEDPTVVKEGDIITFVYEGNQIVTHRIVDVLNQSGKVFYQTKGDNNEDPDSNLVISDNVLAKYTGMTIPYVGYLLKFASTPIGTAILLIIPGALLLGYSIIMIRQAIKEIEGKMKNEKATEAPKNM